jgi:NAD(P)-dependent dehydrogenase (short-subunit alcohol dehydrogenase family)
MDLGLAGKTAIVTGGSGGIGRGLVLEFAREGANVVSVDQDSGDHLVEEAKRQGLFGTIVPLEADITDRRSVDAMVAAVHDRLGPIDILVNNAGGGAKLGPAEELDDATRAWNAAVNIEGMINCTLAAGADMLARRVGSIINISSNASLSGKAAMMNVQYGAAKGFVNSWGKGLAWEWADRGVRINTIAPGWIVPHSGEHVRGPGSWWNKPALKSLGKPEDYDERLQSGQLEKKNGTIPIARVGRPEDIAYLALFLASDVSSYLTGQLISVSGGSYMP